MTATQVLATVADDMSAIDALIRSELNSDVVLINQLSDYLIAAGGKRLRPALVVLAGHALQPNLSDDAAHRLHTAAAIVEFIHSATLLHDDVVDESDQRRGQDTANNVWGNAASVLTGDFLYSRAFQMMVRLDAMPVMQLLAQTTNRIAEGEVLQLLGIGDASMTETRYFDVIERKTAVLFAAAAQLPAILLNAGPEAERALSTFGQQLGLAFQLVDDALDYTGDAATMGKNVGDDLAEGKPTLPLLHLMQNGSKDAADRVRHAIRNGNTDDLQQIAEDVRAAGSIDYTLHKARAAGQAARDALTGLRAKGDAADSFNCLGELVDLAIDRIR